MCRSPFAAPESPSEKGLPLIWAGSWTPGWPRMPDGIACVIGTPDVEVGTIPATPRVRWLTPELAKKLEFDLVVLMDPE